MARRGSTRAGVAIRATLLMVVPVIAVAQPVDEITVSGPTDYDALPASVIIESVVTNVVTLTFPPAGGPFTGNAVLELFHDVPSQGCSFASGHFHELSGTFDPSTLVFAGTFLETEEETGLVAGECDTFSFVRTFDNDAGEFFARLDPVAGTITTTLSVEPLFFTLEVDPTLVADLVPPTTTRAPVDPDATTPGDAQTDPDATPGDSQTDPSIDPDDATTTDSIVTPEPVPADGAGDIPPALVTTDDVDSTAQDAAADADDGGGLGLPLLLLIAAVVVLLVLFALFKLLGTSTPTGPIPAGAGAPGDAGPRTGDSDYTPLTDNTAAGPGTDVTADELEKIPPARDFFETPAAGVPSDGVSADELAKIPSPGASFPADSSEDAEDEDCSRLEKAYRDAKDACADAEAEAKRLGNEAAEAGKRAKQAEADLADLPSEETRVELPDGTSLSQLDLHLRRQAAGAAWDTYMAHPTPETARAAEDAWNEQATPEWLESQRAAHQAEKERIQDRLDQANTEKQKLDDEGAEAQSRARDACRERDDLKRELDRCKKAEEEKRRAAEKAERAAEEARRAEEERKADEERRLAEEEERQREAATAPPPVGATGGDGERRGRCKDGDTRSRMVSQKTFRAFGSSGDDLGSVEITVKMLGKSSGATTDRTISGGMGKNGLDFPTPKEPPKGIDSFMQLTDGSLSDPIDKLIDAWDGLGTSGQFLYITLEAAVAEVRVSCIQEEVCVNGEWKQRQRETKEHWSPRTIRTDPNMIRRVGSDAKAELTKAILDFKAQLEPYARGRNQIQEFKKECLAGKG